MAPRIETTAEIVARNKPLPTRSVLVYLQDGDVCVAEMENGEVVKDILMTNPYSMGLEIGRFLKGPQSVD
jgi:hypothetical protein